MACSGVRLTYSQGPLLAYWWIDAYVDFNAEQAPRAKTALEDWFDWHRATQLLDYAALLSAAQRLAVDNVTAAQVCRMVEEGERRLELAFDQAVPAMAELVRSFSPAQLQHLEQRYAKGNAEWVRDRLQSSATERQEAANKRWLDRAESIYGALDAAQGRLLAEGQAAASFDAERWLAERRLRQQDILRGLRQMQAERADAARVQAMLRAFATHINQSPRADYRAYRQQQAQANCGLIARLHNVTSDAQRQKAVGRLKVWEDDLRALARNGAPAKSTATVPATQ